MNADDYLPNDATVAAIEKDIAVYNERRKREAAELRRREPALLTAYVVGVALLSYVAFRLVSTTNPFMAVFVPVLGAAMWPRARDWVRNDATWTQQSFRNHIMPVMLGFVPDVRYSNGITPRTFSLVPKGLLPPHNHVAFDDVVSGSLDGHRFELFEVKLEMRSKNSNSVVFRGVILTCKRRDPFPGTLLATRRVGDFKRFMRDLFGTGGLTEVSVRDVGLSGLYEFRTDNAREARKLLAGPLSELLTWISRRWRADMAQLAVSRDNVFLLLPTTREHFELPPIDQPVSYGRDIEPMARQFSGFLAIVAEVHKLDEALPPAGTGEPSSENAPANDIPTPPQASEPPPDDDEPFIPLLGGDEPPPKS